MLPKDKKVIVFSQFIQDYPEFATASQAQFSLYRSRASLHRMGAPGLASETWEKLQKLQPPHITPDDYSPNVA